MSSNINLKALRALIPAQCFKPTLPLSLYYLFRDLLFSASLFISASILIPSLPSFSLKITTWLLYGWAQGLVFTGLWVLGHECGHGAFSTSKTINNTIGFALHSCLLTPYFSWRSTHRRHHRFAGHMDKDNNHVPLREAEYVKSFGSHLYSNVQDAPIYVLWRLLLQQFIGWPLYLMLGITGGIESTARKPLGNLAEKNHFNPKSVLFLESEAHLVAFSGMGVAANFIVLVYLGKVFGFGILFLLYGQPFLWLNQWIVALTYLQHTHPDLPRHEAATWTFAKGAMATMDRDLGIIGRVFLHNVVDYHVIHHMFPSIPFYYAKQATEAVLPALGDTYHKDSQNLLWSLWVTFRNCQYVAVENSISGNEQPVRFRSGKVAPLRRLWK